MERLWSPWRSQHIESFKTEDAREAGGQSLFARLAAEDRDEENLILWRGERVFVIMNLYPYNNGHLMVVPFREVASYEALSPEEQVEIAHTIDRCLRWLRHALQPEGFNVGMNLGAAAGAGIPQHLHVHVVPRWQGDTNFMPVVGEAKVIPEALRDTYRKLRAAIEADVHRRIENS
jgi:ATP adenylyltransferase